jgi:c-di-GMP-binding flagellar brake protein YcgR
VLSDETGENRTQTVPLVGFTRDISETGLALVVPSLRVGDRYLVDEGCTLRVVLVDLPTGEVEIFCTPRRYEELQGTETGHLIGVEITEMTETDRSRLIQYLKTLH